MIFLVDKRHLPTSWINEVYKLIGDPTGEYTFKILHLYDPGKIVSLKLIHLFNTNAYLFSIALKIRLNTFNYAVLFSDVMIVDPMTSRQNILKS